MDFNCAFVFNEVYSMWYLDRTACNTYAFCSYYNFQAEK